MSTEISTTVVVTNPVMSALHPGYNVAWVEPKLVEPEDEIEDSAIIALFEDLPAAEPRDYAEVELDDCQCDECLGIYDDRDNYYDDYDDYGGGLDWNDSGYFD